jgi:hypothetical protein
VFLLREEFTTDEDAPITTPRTCEPGPGTLVFLQTDGTFGISGGSLVVSNQSTPAWNKLGYYGTVKTRAIGLACIQRVTQANINGRNLFGWLKATTINYNSYTGINPGYINGLKCGNNIGSSVDFGITLDTNTNIVCHILRSTGAFLIFGSTLGWVDTSGSDVTVYPGYSQGNVANSANTQDWCRVAQLLAPWSTDYGICTNRIASASAGDTTTGEGDAIIDATWTAVTGQTWRLETRRTDADNLWAYDGSQAGSTLKVIERNAGSEAERASSSQTWTNGTAYREVVIQDGNVLKPYVANVAKTGYTSAFNNTATGVRTDKAVTNLVCWPRVLSGAALAELQRWTV